MLIIECDQCGEVIGASNKDELLGRLKLHLRRDHDKTIVQQRLKELVEERCYYATDA